jgi:hypothetical protein
VTDPWNAEDPAVYMRQRRDNRPWEPFAGRISLAWAEMMVSEVLFGAKFMDMCELPSRSDTPLSPAAKARILGQLRTAQKRFAAIVPPTADSP